MIKFILFLSLTLTLCFSFGDQVIMSNLRNRKNQAKTETECGGEFRFLTTPFTKMFTFVSGNMQNTGSIPGIPTCGSVSFAIGSVTTKAPNKDHVNYLLGDIQKDVGWKYNAFLKWTWWDDNGITPALDFGGKLIAITNSGEKDNWSSFYGVWRFVMIPLKEDASFDIVPGGFSYGLHPDYIGFNLIAYV